MERATWWATPARRPAASRFAVAVSKNATDLRLPTAATLLVSTTADAPASALSSPAPVVRSTPVERATTTGVSPASQSASTTSLPTQPVPPATAIFTAAPLPARRCAAAAPVEQVLASNGVSQP